MGLTYDPLDAPLTEVGQVIALNRSTFGPVWSGQGGFDSSNPFSNKQGLICLDVDTTKLSKAWYNFASAAQIAAMDKVDQASYVPALLSVAADGLAADKIIGSVYATYEIELIEPTPGQ